MEKEHSHSPLSPEIEELFLHANSAKQRAYCPYSKFRVGAALLTASGKIYSGCNVENAAYSLGICAERTAVAKAVSEGETSFKKIAVVSDVKIGFTAPCGACRQTLAEFGLDLEVYLLNPNNQSKLMTLHDLLPLAFTPRDLEKARTSDGLID